MAIGDNLLFPVLITCVDSPAQKPSRGPFRLCRQPWQDRGPLLLYDPVLRPGFEYYDLRLPGEIFGIDLDFISVADARLACEKAFDACDTDGEARGPEMHGYGDSGL